MKTLLAFVFHQRARVLAQNAHPDSLHWDHRPGEAQRGDKRKTKGRKKGETKRKNKMRNVHNFYPKFCPEPMLEHPVHHFQDIAKKNYCIFFEICFRQNMLKNEISIHKFCSQSILKYSVVHFQGMALKFWKIWMRFQGYGWRNLFFNPPIFFWLAFEWDLRDIDGATHFWTHRKWNFWRLNGI